MDKVRRYTKIVSRYDRRLFAVNAGTHIQIHRQADRLDQTFLGSPMTQYILALTDTWKPDGQSAEWGELPLLAQLKSMDRWVNPIDLDEMRKQRDAEKSDKQRMRGNEIAARAADLRKDFARVTNDINTSTLEKVDKRRMKNGYC